LNVVHQPVGEADCRPSPEYVYLRSSTLLERSGDLIQGAIQRPVDRAIESGDVCPDLDPLYLLRTLVDVSDVASVPDWPQSGMRLVDVLLLLGSCPDQ
jgi:hypothetical protein